MRADTQLKGDVMSQRARRLMSSTMALVLLSACATTPGADRLAERDPLRGFNRAMWGVNHGLDKAIARPVTKVYQGVTPKPVRSGIANFFSNLTEPWSFINALLQGKPNRAGRALERFVVNSTVGIGGLMDVAGKHGKKQQPEDLGQTLAVWGVNGGPYLMLPLLGPTTFRDGAGTLVESFADPINICKRECGIPKSARLGLTVASLISARSELMDSGADKLLDNSADSYATVHSAYLQRRRALILDSDDDAGAGSVDLEDFDTSGSDTEPPTPPADATQSNNAAPPAGNGPAAAGDTSAPAPASPAAPPADATTPATAK